MKDRINIGANIGWKEGKKKSYTFLRFNKGFVYLAGGKRPPFKILLI